MSYLMDTSSESIWSIKYKDSGLTSLAEWAVGSSGIELYIASYNATHQAYPASINVPRYYSPSGYSVNGNIGGSEIWVGTSPILDEKRIVPTDCHGIYSFATYYPSGDSCRYWIGSPCVNGGSLYVYGDNTYLSTSFTEYDWCSRRCRPVVSIPTSIFNSTLLSGLTDE